MYAVRQIIDDPRDTIPVPPELRHRHIEVIFLAIDDEDAIRSATRAQAAVEAPVGRVSAA
jgi:hypothetical protein